MTVIEFGTKDIRINLLYIALGVLVVISAFFSIISYNGRVSMRHENEILRGEISREQVRNAELKNAFYESTESFDSEAYPLQHGYVLDSKPAYDQVTVISDAD